MTKRGLTGLDVAGKRMLVRVDFNIPIEQGIEAIASYDQRLRATLPTIHYLLERDCRVILCSHLGRPGGNVTEELRLAPVGDRLGFLLDRPVKSLADFVGPGGATAFAALASADALLHQNLALHPVPAQHDSR